MILHIFENNINVCAWEIGSYILKDTKDKWFSFFIDESQDSSKNKANIWYIIGLVKDLGRVVDRSLGVVHVSNTYAQYFKKMHRILFFTKHELLISMIRHMNITINAKMTIDGSNTIKHFLVHSGTMQNIEFYCSIIRCVFVKGN